MATYAAKYCTALKVSSLLIKIVCRSLSIHFMCGQWGTTWLPLRFCPHFKVLDYSGGKEKREELRDDITAHVSSQGRGWARATFPFHIMLAHYDVIVFLLWFWFQNTYLVYLYWIDSAKVAIRDSAFLARFPWQCLVVDEGHRLKNSSSVLYERLQEVWHTPSHSHPTHTSPHSHPTHISPLNMPPPTHIPLTPFTPHSHIPSSHSHVLSTLWL